MLKRASCVAGQCTRAPEGLRRGANETDGPTELLWLQWYHLPRCVRGPFRTREPISESLLLSLLIGGNDRSALDFHDATDLFMFFDGDLRTYFAFEPCLS